MAQPHKGDRAQIMARPVQPVYEEIQRRAQARGMSNSQYAADVLALHVSRPDLVRELGDRDVLPLAGTPRTHQGGHTPIITQRLMTRPAQPVYEEIRRLAAERDKSMSQYAADVLALHIGRPDLVRARGDQEVLPLAM